MSTNLLELLNAHLTEDVVAKIANFLGDTPKNTGSALGSALPSLLSGLVQKSSDSQGAGILYNLFTQNYDAGLLSNLGASLVGGDVTNKLVSSGAALLNSIFGNKTDNIAEAVASSSGLNKGASSSLLGLLTPIIFAVIGKTIKAQNITNPSGLASLLAGQGGFLKNLVPASLAGLFGSAAAGLAASSTASTMRIVDEPPKSPASPVSTSSVSSTTLNKAPELNKDEEPMPKPVVREAKVTPAIVNDDEDDDVGIFGKLLPWLILGSILALGWGIWNNLKKPAGDANAPTAESSTPAPDAVATTDSTTPPPAPAPDAAANEPAPAVAEPTPAPAPAETPATPGKYEHKLSTGYVLSGSGDGIENKLVAYLEDANSQIDKTRWFNMDGILFDTGKATLRPESMPQITNIVEIMKAFPKVKIKLGGYTDNTGKPKANLKLSSDRAHTIQNTLVKAGIDKGRVGAEGYGSDHPVASNDTPEGRQKNRRIDVNVTEK